MKPLSKTADSIQASTTLAIDSLFKKMKADGIDVVGFGAGEPDFPTPENIKSAGIEAIRADFTKYTPVAGIEELKKAVCDRLFEDCGVSYRPSQVMVASGAKHNVFIALASLLDPGDEVILPAPYWVSYYEQIKMHQGVPVIVESEASEGFKIKAEQLEAAISGRTKCLILNSPSNPTGAVYSKKELEALTQVCVDRDIYIIADEIYYSLLYDGLEFVSVASLGEEVKKRTILINGVSKSYSMTGWRIGYALAEEEIVKVMSSYVSHSTSAPASFSQKAAFEALSGPQGSREEMRKAFEQRRDYMLERMEKIEGISVVRPEGAFYIMMSIEELIGKSLYGRVIRDADDFCALFLEKGLVATVPCTGFGAPAYVRWAYAVSMDTIKTGLDRLESFLRG